MKYERKIEESREYEYGIGKEFETEYMANEYMRQLKNKTLTQLILKGFTTSIEEMNVIKVKDKNAFKLTTVIRYPKQIFEEQEEE